MKKRILAFAAPITQGNTHFNRMWNVQLVSVEQSKSNNSGRNIKKYHFLDAHTHQTESTFSLYYSVLGCL